LTFAVPEDMKKWQSFVAGNLEARTKKEQELKQSAHSEDAARKDFFHYLFGAKDSETGKEGYTIDELWGECELLTIAGSDTTAIVTAAMTFYLAKNPRMQEKVAKEVRSTFSSYEEIVYSPKLHSCRYLRAFIQETLRVAPPVPADLAREVLPGGTTICGKFFPQDMKVSTCLYCLSHNPDVYPEPMRFRPERWVTKAEDPEGVSGDDVALAESGACSFAAGTRGCIGKNMAWMEMMVVLAKLVYRFELKQQPGNNLGGGMPNFRPGHQQEDRYQLYDAFVAMRNGPMIQFKERK
jgi:cytochrome P450